MNRREFIIGGATLAAGALEAKTTDGGFAAVSWPARRKKDIPVLPRGAHGSKRFASKCVGCSLCATACPSKCLRPSPSPSRFGRVELDFRYGWCKPECSKCAEVCPAGAIEKFPDGAKPVVRTGYAVWSKDLCLRTSEGVNCHACRKHCPAKAVKLIGDAIIVDRDACIGCGACEHYCPARPDTAIRVEGLEVHRETRPVSEAEVAEARRSRADGTVPCAVSPDECPSIAANHSACMGMTGGTSVPLV